MDDRLIRRGGCIAMSKQFISANDIVPTLEATDYKDPMTVCYGVCSFASNSMMSDNPNSGFYEAKTSRTLDLNCGNPACNQGGTVVVQCIEGQSCCTDTKKSFTLQAGGPDDHHIPDVCYPNVTGALCANSHPGSYTGQDAFNNMLPVIKEGKKYVVRRLTPVECARLQGFPDWWTDGAEGSDSAIFKMWGNGIALSCAADVLGRISKELERSNNNGRSVQGRDGRHQD